MRKTRIIEVLQAALLVSRAYAAEERRENEKARMGGANRHSEEEEARYVPALPRAVRGLTLQPTVLA